MGWAAPAPWSRRLASAATTSAGGSTRPAQRAVVDAAIDAGITLFDTADIYGGGGGQRAVSGRGAAGPPRQRGDRHQVRDGHARRRWATTRRAGDRATTSGGPCEASLQRLQTDRIDLYQYHEPDGVTPIAETLGAIDELVAEGKVLSIGSRTSTPAEIEEADALARAGGLGAGRERAERVQPAQPPPRGRRDAGLRAARHRRSCPTSRWPAACSPANTGAARRLPRERGCQVAMRSPATSSSSRSRGSPHSPRPAGSRCWTSPSARCWPHPTVSSVIAGATSPEQVRTNVAAGRWRPTPDDLAEIDRITPPPEV